MQNRDLFQIEAYRQDELAKIFMDDPARPMSIAARDAGEKALRAVYGPVREDMIDFIKKTGERRDVDKFMVTNQRLKELAGELEMNTLKSVLKSGKAVPDDVNKLLFSTTNCGQTSFTWFKSKRNRCSLNTSHCLCFKGSSGLLGHFHGLSA